MKKTILTLFIVTLLITPVYADSTERVRVIKFDKEAHDLVVEQQSGKRLLIQHNRLCSTMSTEFPVNLIWTDDTITQLKVAYNEICKVYNTGQYSDYVTIVSRTRSMNPLIKDHEAEIEWRGKKYEVSYGDGCENIRDFVGRGAYIYTPQGSLSGATLYLPSNRGQCTLNSTEFVETVEVPENIETSPIKNLQHRDENNSAFFIWDEDISDSNWLYLIAHSKYQLDPSDYHWRQMPNLRFSTKNSYTATRLANNQKYYFYLSARDNLGNVAPWVEVEVTPVLTRFVYKNNIDVESFEIEIAEETDDYYLLTWPDKSEASSRYLIQFFVNGNRKLLKIIPGDQNTFEVKKEPAYEGGGFRLTVRSIPLNRFGARFNDGIFWE